MIPFMPLSRIHRKYELEFQEAFTEVMQKGQFILGEQVKLFEQEFAAYCGTGYAIGTGNGLDALVLILKGYIELGKLKPGDEVLVPAHTFFASVLAVYHAELTPVLVEPGHGYLIDRTTVASKITSKTRAILPVHLYGELVDMEGLQELISEHNLLVIEDAAQAHGAQNKSGLKAGALGHAAAFSFYPAKNLGAMGDGGMITTSDSELASVVKSIRNYGARDKYQYVYSGINSRLDELQAALLRIKLKHLNADNHRRRQIALKYLQGIVHPEIQLPVYDGSENHVFHLFVVQSSQRNDLKNYLLQCGVETAIHYPIPPHQQEAFNSLKGQSYPKTERLHQNVLSLPMSPVHTDDEIEAVISYINSF
jgi:dTDP-4-amino-4,6-dideoxygalactose transaminase